MLKLTLGGYMMGGLDAIEFMEMLPDNIPDEVKDDDFCEEYERALNRFRYEIAKSIPIKPQVTKAISKSHSDYYSCGKCGHSLNITNDYCPKCGRQIGWDNPRCLTK